MFSTSSIKKNIIAYAIILFIIIYIILNTVKPGFLYNKKGQLRAFGLNYSNRTIIPLWLTVICIATISYLAVLCYVTYSRIQY